MKKMQRSLQAQGFSKFSIKIGYILLKQPVKNSFIEAVSSCKGQCLLRLQRLAMQRIEKKFRSNWFSMLRSHRIALSYDLSETSLNCDSLTYLVNFALSYDVSETSLNCDSATYLANFALVSAQKLYIPGQRNMYIQLLLDHKQLIHKFLKFLIFGNNSQMIQTEQMHQDIFRILVDEKILKLTIRNKNIVLMNLYGLQHAFFKF